MKLEELLYKQEIQDIRAFNKDVIEAIEEIVEKYHQSMYATDTARGLVNIAINTKNKDAVIESLKTIEKYEGRNALGISYNTWCIVNGLEDIAKNTKNTDMVIKTAKIMSLDEIVDSVKNNTYIDKLVKIAAYAEDKDAVIKSAKTIEKYEGRSAWNIADELGNIAESTKNKDAVIESAKIIGKYEERSALSIAYGLRDIAVITKDPNIIIKTAKIMSLDEIVDSAKNKTYIDKLVKIAAYTEDKDAVIESAKIIGKYEGMRAWSIADGLGDIAESTKDKDAVIESLKIIEKYEEIGAGNVADGLGGIAGITKDPNMIIKATRIMSLDEIVDSVKNNIYISKLVKIAAYTEDKDAVIESAKIIEKYEGRGAGNVAYGLGDIAESTKNKDAVIESAKIIGKYEEEGAENIAYGLGDIAKNTRNTDRIIKTAKIMSLDEIVDSVKNNIYISKLVKIAAYTEDKDAMIESAKIIGKYEEMRALSIADGLGNIAESTKNKDAVIESLKTIEKYEEDTANEITYALGTIAEDTRDIDTLMTACKITNLAGADVFNILTSKDFFAIKNKKLDDLINDKESFDAVVAHIKSGFELPIPNKDNIINYKKVASKYISERYGIKRDLNINQILMLFSVDSSKRGGLFDLINNSSEIGLKMYNIATKETKRLEVNDKLPYLSIIAVTGSRDSAINREAYDYISEIVGEKAVRKARNEFNSHYKNKIREIASYVKKNEIDKAIDYLKSTKNEAIEDVLRYADYKDLGFTKGKTTLSAVESNNPLDYDNRVQIACVYLPNDYYDGIYNYCRNYYSRDKDKGFVLVRYNIGGKALGSAICYMENNTFLVDSVEGHRTFRKPQIFNAVYQDLVERAREKGAEKVIFNENCMNETPNKFIEFLGNSGLKKGNVDMKLNTEGYLEAEKENVKGYIIDL